MRSFIVMAMFVAGSACAAWFDYTEERELSLAAKGIASLEIKAGAGSMEVRGVDGQDEILVEATIVVADTDDDDAAEIIEKRMRLSLDRRGDVAFLEATFDDGWLGTSDGGRIDLDVTMPTGLALAIDDSSGSIDVMDTEADLEVDDGSGSIDINNVANVVVEDGSGSIDIARAAGDVNVIDGSGSITVRSVAGSVTIDDGSGSIKVSDVEEDLILVDGGSGSFRYSDVRGTVDGDT